MIHAGYGNITIKTERGEIMNDKKKILAAAGILVLAGAAATAFYIWKKNKTQVATSVGIIGGADGPTSIFLAGKLDNSADEGTKAAVLDLETAKKQPYGQVVELDYVSIDRISLTVPSDTLLSTSMAPMILRQWSRWRPTPWKRLVPS